MHLELSEEKTSYRLSKRQRFREQM